MQQVLERAPARVTFLDIAWEWLHRLLAVYCLVFGVFYWARLVGVYQDDFWRFDLMPPQWQVAAVSLAVLFPFAASGLWMLASWGVAIWFICAFAETVMYAGFPETFGSHLEIVAVHLFVAASYLSMRVAFFLRARKQQD